MTKKKSESPKGIELSWPSSLRVLRSSVVRASDRCMEGHWFNSCRGLRRFLCPVFVTKLITSFPKDQSAKLLFSTTECLDLPVPLNGRMSCQMFSGKKVCTLTCNDGYSYNTETTPTYDCGPDTEWRWNGLEGFNVPACSSMSFFFYIQFFSFPVDGRFCCFLRTLKTPEMFFTHPVSDSKSLREE